MRAPHPPPRHCVLRCMHSSGSRFRHHDAVGNEPPPYRPEGENDQTCAAVSPNVAGFCVSYPTDGRRTIASRESKEKYPHRPIAVTAVSVATQRAAQRIFPHLLPILSLHQEEKKIGQKGRRRELIGYAPWHTPIPAAMIPARWCP